MFRKELPLLQNYPFELAPELSRLICTIRKGGNFVGKEFLVVIFFTKMSESNGNIWPGLLLTMLSQCE